MASQNKPSGLTKDHRLELDLENSSKLDTIPKEIISEILSRLPVESLLRLKCLNKSWYFLIRVLIKDRKFVTKHIHSSEASDQILLLSFHERGVFNSDTRLPVEFADELITSIHAVRIVDNEDSQSIDCVTQDLDLPSPLNQRTSPLAVCYCNGIICLSYDFQTFTLYNPALREHEMFNLISNRNGVEAIGMGFGCDSTDSNYKIVRLFGSMEAEIFTPGDTSTHFWRKVGFNIRCQRLRYVDHHVHVKGNCFWMIQQEQYSILCFNVGGEAFHDILLPADIIKFDWNLARYNDSLCAMKNNIPKECLEMWVMDVDGVGGAGACRYSWTKFLKIKCIPTLYSQVILWKSSVIMVDDTYNALTVHNILTEKYKYPFSGERLFKVLFVESYVKSLVSVKGMN